MIEKNSEMLEEMNKINEVIGDGDSEYKSMDSISVPPEIEKEITLDDLGELVEDEQPQPQMTPDQMKKFMSYVNSKVNHFKKQGNKLTQRRNKNKLAKKSRKKNRK